MSRYQKELIKNEQELFGQIKSSFMDYDPAYFVENNLTIDGQPFRIIGNGWKFMADIYRYIALQATTEIGKPVVLCKGRQVGATMMAGALDLYLTNSGLFSNPPIRVLHAFPALAMVKKFTQDKMEGMIRSAKGDFINQNKLINFDKNAVDNLTMKQFNTGTLWIDSLGRDADRIRGMTCDVTFFDEVQDMYGLAIGNATKILTQAKYGPVGKGVQVYFGTPKERTSYFHSIWEMSDQRYYHLGCSNCKQTFPFYLSGDDRWQTIWVEGFTIQCPLCGHKQHKIQAIENGRWVPTRDPEEAKYVGFHINQLYIPSFPKQNILDLMPENNPTQSSRVWNNEVIGEFYSGAGLPLTKADIYERCRDADRSFARKIDPVQKKTYLGVDWGGKIDNDHIDRGQSFSCVVVLSAQADGTLLIEHAHKIGEHGFKHKIATIKECYRRFGVIRGVSDFFYGNDVVNDLQLLYKDRFLGAQGSGNLIKPVKFREDELMITYNKDLVIDEIFDKLRKGKIRFPWKSYEHIEWLIDHCTSMEMGVRISNGQQIKTFKKGSIPNDGLMALMYAYMAWKFDATRGFTVKPGIDQEITMPRPSLAHLPRLR
nr:hypothetical protein 53 [bacterium]